MKTHSVSRELATIGAAVSLSGFVRMTALADVAGLVAEFRFDGEVRNYARGRDALVADLFAFAPNRFEVPDTLWPHPGPISLAL